MTTILVVDDEVLYQKLLRANLETEGFEIITADNGEEALETISTEAPQSGHPRCDDAKTG